MSTMPIPFAHFHLFAVKRNGDAFFEFDRNFRFLVGSLFRRHAEHEQMIVIGRVGGILEFQPFVTDVPYIAVAAVRSVGGEGKIDAVSAAVIDFFLARGHRPFIVSPGRDYLQIGSERFDAEFETDLIVAFARSAVADCRSAFLARYLHEFFGDEGTGHGRTEKILIFVNGARFDARHYVIVAELVDDVVSIVLVS